MPDTILSPKALREKRLPLGKRIEELRNTIAKENRDFTAEERKNWEDVNKEYDGLTLQIQVAERAESVRKELDSPVIPAGDTVPGNDPYDARAAEKQRRREEKLGKRQAKLATRDFERRGWLANVGPDGKTKITEEHRALGLQAWCRMQTGRSLKPEHIEACRVTGIKPNRRSLDLRLPGARELRKIYQEHRALSLNINTAGGYTVPEGFVNNLEIALLAYANVRSFATVMRTASGQDLPWPTVNDTSNKGAILAENATVTQQDTTFGQMIFHAYKYTSKLVLVPVELMEDSAFDLASTLGELLGIRIGRIQADHFTTGTGAGQPAGFITAGTKGRTAASSTAISTDDLYQLKHAVDPEYRRQPGVGWVMHDKILMQIKLLKDGLGRPLWQQSIAGGVPDTIDNDPIFIDQSMDNTIASGKNTVAYGALKKYVIRDVSQIRLRRLVERYADSDQEGFVMFMRADGNLLDAGTHPLQYMQH